MLIQILRGRVRDPELFNTQAADWGTDLRPKASGWLGSTWGITRNGTGVIITRFESADAAKSYPDQSVQKDWLAQLKKAFEGEPEFLESEDVDLYLQGGSDDAGFVQIMEGTAKNKDDFKEQTATLNADLGKTRPDLLGSTRIWLQGGHVIIVAYFKSEAEARKKEAEPVSANVGRPGSGLLEGEITFYDLKTPSFS
jgi:hypothetical protein